MRSWVLVLLLWTCASWSMDCGFTTDPNGIKIYKCSQCGIPTGAGRLNIQSALDNLLLNLKMTDLVPNDLSFSFSLPIPHACISLLCSPSSIDFGVNARNIMGNLGIRNVNLASGLVGNGILPADWSSVIGDLCFETSFEMCTAKISALARLNDVTIFEFDFSLLDGVFNQGCGTVNVGALSVTYNKNTKTLVISQAISPLFQNSVAVTLRNLTISEDGLSFCGQVNLVGSQALSFDIGCVEFGTVDTCSQYNGDCSGCTSNGCGWCAEKGICSSPSATGLCGGCLSGYLQTCDDVTISQRITEYKPVLDSFKSIDQNGDFKLSRAETGGKTGKWVDGDSNFDDMDQNEDDEVTLAEYKEYQTTKDQPKVSGGAVAGIVIGVLVGVAGIGAASFFVYKKKLWEKIPKLNLPNLPNLPKIGKQ